MIKWVKYLNFVLIPATLVMAVTAFLLILNLVTKAQEIEESFRDNLLGMAAQADHELQSLIDTLERLANEEPNVTPQHVADRFDIFWSRVETNSSGTAADFYLALDGAEEALSQARQLLDELEPDIVQIQTGEYGLVRDVASRLRTLQPLFHRATMNASSSNSRSASELYNTLKSAGFWSRIVLPGMVVAGMIAGAVIWIERRDLNRLAQALEERVDHRTSELRAANQLLMHEIAERECTEVRLVQAQKMEAVGQLTGGVAHDFNNLLAVIMGNTELLQRRLGREDVGLGAIIRASKRGAELTQRLLAFSRQQPLSPRVIDVGALVSHMSQLLLRTLGEAIEIETHVAQGLWAASADPAQVENAVLNLALNSRDAMRGSGKLSVDCTNTRLDKDFAADDPEAKAGDYVVLAVTDSGVGMTADVQEHAFEPFFTTKEVGKGSGLGLSMVYGFAKQSGGHVTIDSEEGVGTTVKLYLPRAKAAAPHAEAVQEQDVPLGQGEVILVIEDDPDVRDLTVRLLADLDYQVIDVGDAAAAHRTLADGAPVNLVLSDVVLPGGTSGPEFAEQASATYPDLGIIFMSGYPAEVAKRNDVLDSDSVLLNKPFHREQLAQALRQALDQSPSGRLAVAGTPNFNPKTSNGRVG